MWRKLPRWPAAVAAMAQVALASCVAPQSPAGGSQSGGAGTGSADGGAGLEPGADSSTCTPLSCPPLECGAGLIAQPLPDDCCPTLCVPSDCSTIDCPPLQCASGAHEAKLSGRCCPTCVANAPATSGETCDQGQAGYADYLPQATASLGAAFCDTDADCRILKLDNPCNHDCGTALNTRVALELQVQLNAYAADHCGACPQTGPGCPPVEQLPFCTGGVCSAH